MSGTDGGALRLAVDIFVEEDGTAAFGKVSAVYKVLTPGRSGHRLTPESAESLGHAVARDGRRGLRIRRPEGAVPSELPDDGACADLAHRFALAAVDHGDGWTEFSVFGNAFHHLRPEGLTGRKLRRAMSGTGRWEFREARLGPPKGSILHGLEADPDDPVMTPLMTLAALRETTLVRKKPESRWPRSMWVTLPGDVPREARAFGSLAVAYSWLAENVPAAFVAQGTVAEIRRVSDGGVDDTLVFDREAGWRRPDGGEPPKALFDGDNYLLPEEIDDAARERLGERDFLYRRAGLAHMLPS